MCKLSIIIPVYNVEKYLGRCVDSVLSQSFSDYELILVDDGSTDSSSEICRNYKDEDSRVVLVSKSNGGVSSARNAGIEAAKGDYITFIDADDYILPGCLDTLNSVIDETGAGLVCYEHASSREKLPETNLKVSVLSSDEIAHMICDGKRISISCWSKVCNRQAIEKAHIRFAEDQTMAEDSLFSIDCFNTFEKIAHISYVGYIYYQERSDNACRRFYPGILSEARTISSAFLARKGGLVCDEVLFYHIYSTLAVAVNLYWANPKCELSVKDASAELSRFAKSEPFNTAIANAEIFFSRDKVMLFLLRRKLYGVYLLLKRKTQS